MNTKAEAEQVGRDMAAQLGKGWKWKVFQNTSWHVYAYYGSMHVMANKYGHDDIRYFCLISDRPNEHTSGSSIWTSNKGGFTDPTDAVLHAVQHAQAIMTRLNTVMDKCAEAVEQFRCKCCNKKRV